MRRLLLAPIFLLLILAQSASAQSEPIDCNELIEGDEEIELQPFNYLSTCATGYDCVDDTDFICQFQLASEMVKLCEPDDLFCRNKALLSSAAVYIQNTPYFTAYEIPQVLIDVFPQIMKGVISGDVESSLELLEEERLDIFFPLIPFSRAVIYEMLGEPEKALEEYNTLLDSYAEYALLHYLRGQLYGQIGKIVDASFETAWLEDYLTAFAPDLLPLIVPLQEDYPLDRSRFTSWTMYPVMQMGFSPGGYRYEDLTQLEPIPIQIGIYEETNQLLAIDISMMRYPWSEGDILNTYVFKQTGDNIYEQDFYIDWGGYDGIILEFRQGIIFGEEHSPGAESGSVIEFMLAPPDQPDPRKVIGEPVCKGGVITRLRPGMMVYEQGFMAGFQYSATPGGELDQFLSFGNPESSDYYQPDITVTDRFTCVNEELWWEITDGEGTTGWRAENTGNEYQINPPERIQQSFFYCPDALRTRIYPYGQARVVPGFGANNVRAEAGLNTQIAGQIPEGVMFTVHDGPVCVDGMAWWKVEYGNLMGWTAEGDSQTYWLEPVYP